MFHYLEDCAVYHSFNGLNERFKNLILRHQLKWSSNPIYCPVCAFKFNTDEYCPLILPQCHHTICKMCIQNVDSKKSCPYCQLTFDAEQLSLNYALLPLINKKSTEWDVAPEMKVAFHRYALH
ncbi:unnamed protein product [Didymodactylos carnosus]|uniref:RING-type domain-containing protein n=1 Tax=Didymodactylos carnosus TaxID=1234261 RepID=A0A814R6E5_9BILA|nr:unnamed protein product [Didymodactylos carnosus]CAF1129233.1 unnamed protein product [Didymodactylos carnosus]CAF3738222.1 unnamed protein product [Didymodactylos carnosus]CAF3892879.1 unnamed protein product [Didymodactylos carnosus]